MKQYCLGFAFNADTGRVLLIEKLAPDWMRGKLNGLGGKIEPGEMPAKAMAREFREECGIITYPAEWIPFCEMRLQYSVVHCFSIAMDDIRFHTYKSPTPERVSHYWPADLPGKVLNNVPWLLAMSRDHDALWQPLVVTYDEAHEGS